MAISKQLRLSRDDVRNYCRKIGLSGRRSTADIVRQTDESVAERVRKSGNNIEYISGYESTKSRITVRCLICGNEWEAAYNKAAYEICRCPCCSEARREYVEYVERVSQNMREIQRNIDALGRRERKKQDWIHKHTRICTVCGNKFLSRRGAIVCSDRCRKRYNNRKGDKRIDARIVDDPDITLESLFTKDKGICHICGKPCDYEDYTVDGDIFIAGNWYPSIDHVIPISKGGRHSWDNVKLAHRLCNSVKSNKT